MKMINRTIAAASLMLAAGTCISGLLPAMAQADEAAEATEFEDEAEFAAECADEAGCADEDVAECIDEAGCATEDDVAAETDEGAAQEPPAAGAVVVVPGSTDESQPGGSTRPGTTPDD